MKKRLDFVSQYEEQVQSLQQLGIVEKLPKFQRFGIVGVDGEMHPLPSLLEISRNLSPEKIDFLSKKQSQGFDRLLVVPFAMDLGQLIDIYRNLLVATSENGKLQSSNGDSLELYEDEPVWVWERYRAADQLEDHQEALMYYPKDEDDCGGYTKKELIRSGHSWNILLIEDLPSLPTKESVKITADRKQLPPGRTPDEYFKMITSDPMYKGEQGFTLEDWLIYSILELLKKNVQIDVYGRELRSACYATASFLEDTDHPGRQLAPLCRFVVNGAQSQVHLDCVPSYSVNDSLYSTRTAVQI